MIPQNTAGPILIQKWRTIVARNISNPTVPGDALLVSDGRIAAIGKRSDLSAPPDVMLIDAAGNDATPGLIDAHIHPEFGDWTSRMSTVGWMAAYAQAGVTTALSQAAFDMANYPRDRTRPRRTRIRLLAAERAELERRVAARTRAIYHSGPRWHTDPSSRQAAQRRRD